MHGIYCIAQARDTINAENLVGKHYFNWKYTNKWLKSTENMPDIDTFYDRIEYAVSEGYGTSNIKIILHLKEEI